MPNHFTITDDTQLEARNQNRSTVVSCNGMVCTSQPLATSVGYDVLKSGGNAIDAAVAANAMLSLVEPMMCGPGGDLFAIVWHEKSQKLFGLNASGRSPYNWTLNQAKELGLTEIPVFGPLSWSVPGCVSGWDALLNRFGNMKLAQLLQPTIDYARNGFPVSPLIANRWAPEQTTTDFQTMVDTFLPGGHEPQFGEIFRNLDLAKFYELLATGGSDQFYKGEIAERIVKFSKQVGGRFELKDFADHKANWIEPVSTTYRDYDVWELPPNGQGLATLQMLNILENFDFSMTRPNSAEHLHLLIEAKKLAFEDRAVYYADMDFADVPVSQLISKEYGCECAKLIDRNKAATEVKPGRLPGHSETIYLTTADAQGNMVSLIQSIYFPWGSHDVPTGMGFCLQNRGQLFSLNPNDMNKLEPHKRPFHTIIPAFVTRDNQPVFSFGVTGGDFQPQGQTQILMNIIDFHMSVQQAGEQPRIWHHESSTPTGKKMCGPGTITPEPHISNAVRHQLTAMGHVIRPEKTAFGGYQGIGRKNEPRTYFGASDPRKDGCAIGY